MLRAITIILLSVFEFIFLGIFFIQSPITQCNFILQIINKKVFKGLKGIQMKLFEEVQSIIIDYNENSFINRGHLDFHFPVKQ